MAERRRQARGSSRGRRLCPSSWSPRCSPGGRWERGAYFGVDLPARGDGAARACWPPCSCSRPGPPRCAGPPRWRSVALLALAAGPCSPRCGRRRRDIAVEDAQRVFIYAVAFALGLWLCLLLGRRMLLALRAGRRRPAALVAVATLIALWIGDDAAELLENDATLRYPLGYRNAVAGLLRRRRCCPMIVLAADRETRLAPARRPARRRRRSASSSPSSRRAAARCSRSSSASPVLDRRCTPSGSGSSPGSALAAVPARARAALAARRLPAGGGDTADVARPAAARPAAAMALTSVLLGARSGCVGARAATPARAVAPGQPGRRGGSLAAVLGVDRCSRARSRSPPPRAARPASSIARPTSSPPAART